jgi:hypothetical protein
MRRGERAIIIASDENLKAETGKAEKLTRFIAESGVQGLT